MYHISLLKSKENNSVGQKRQKSHILRGGQSVCGYCMRTWVYHLNDSHKLVSAKALCLNSKITHAQINRYEVTVVMVYLIMTKMTWSLFWMYQKSE